ncbi:FG-GAP-like repeat-containing protein [Psychroserpens ponticola]|uniref:FG-GAP-like repeat-containing protein n=1 Tax=Psychroserpens ponticola TaxID=2932268 RepID=A0ABY7RTN8_9FLAO|nr:FG-GAP-like repeat-containing protein [Psychroserpens ponticola]WCO00472.1 FG-GAP-like repeat-containing protein [Psychroserpens ponticola]
MFLIKKNGQPFVSVLVVLLVTISLHSQVIFQNNAIPLGLVNNSSTGSNLGGVSFFDYDNDGWDDITIACKGDDPVRFFKNISGQFVEQFYGMTITGHSKQVIWVDYDNDDDNDLFVTRLDGINLLYQNDGNLNFTNVTVAAGFSNFNILSTYGATFGDIDNDGYLDLFISNKDVSGTLPNKLFRNNGNGTFTDISISSGISLNGHLTFCASFFDYDKDGFQDIYMSNDRILNTNILYRNNGDNTFTDVSAASGTDVAANAMSTTIDDYNYDGWLDIYITNTVEGNHLLKNNGDGTFNDIAIDSGLSFNSIGWGANFFDADNDTDLDLYISSYIDNPNIGLLTAAFYECQEGYTYQLSNTSGFEDDIFKSFSNAIGDIDNDGFQDFIVANQTPNNHSLWQNQGNTNNWLKVKLKGVQSNKNGIGSWIEVFANNEVMYRYTICGEAFLGQNSATEIFGIGDATTIDYVKVTWLSGVEDVLTDVTPNQTLLIEESSTLSTSEHQLKSIRMLPNPTNGIVTVKNFTETLDVQVVDYLGRLILTKTITQADNSINLSNYSKGVYLLKAKGETSHVIKKIIRN